MAGSTAPTTDAEGPFTLDDVTVAMGTYNEEAAVASVLEAIDGATEGRADVVCVDGSSDRTAEIARDHGARVIEQEPQGYGVALLAALSAADRPVVITTDCDDTYPMERIPEFLDAINEGAAVVSGDRLTPGAETMPPINRLGNRLFAIVASALAGHPVADTTTGMRAYRREVIDAFEWTENTGLSAELLLRPLIRGYPVRELPIDYRERAGETTLDPIAGGVAIGWSIVRVCVAERLRRWLGR